MNLIGRIRYIPKRPEHTSFSIFRLFRYKILQVFDPAFNFFLFTVIKWSSIRAAQVTANPARYRHTARFVITAFRTGKAFTGAAKFAGKTAVIALINWGVGAVIRHTAVTIIPDVF